MLLATSDDDDSLLERNMLPSKASPVSEEGSRVQVQTLEASQQGGECGLWCPAGMIGCIISILFFMFHTLACVLGSAIALAAVSHNCCNWETSAAAA